MNKLTVNLDKLGKILSDRGWYHLSLRLNVPEGRGEGFNCNWTNDLLKKYLELHCGKKEASDILNEVKTKEYNLRTFFLATTLIVLVTTIFPFLCHLYSITYATIGLIICLIIGGIGQAYAFFGEYRQIKALDKEFKKTMEDIRKSGIA